jgi:DNA-binding MarR family transcriptional regulator
MKISEKLNFLFLVSKTDAKISRTLGGNGLGFKDLAVLYAISQAHEGKIRRTDLAQAVGLTASGVTRLLIPLEKTGFIKREANKFDARVSYTSLTKAGKELFEDAIKWAEMKCNSLISNDQKRKIKSASSLLENVI